MSIIYTADIILMLAVLGYFVLSGDCLPVGFFSCVSIMIFAFITFFVV